MKKSLLFIVMAINIAFLIVFWATWMPRGVPWDLYMYSAGKLLALVGFLLLLYQYFLSSRIRWLERGIGLDRLFVIHRSCGIVGLFLVFFHPVLLVLYDALQGYGVYLSGLKTVGIISLVILVAIAIAALLNRGLKLRYETWKNLHRATYVLLPLAFVHSFFLGSSVRLEPLRSFWLILGALYLYVLGYRAWKWISIRRNPYTVDRVEKKTHDTWSVYFRGTAIQHNPGQFMILRLVRNGKVSEPHPFTISSSPTGDTLSVTVKAVGDFTATIGNTKSGDKAFIDAPYGAFSFLNYDASDLVFICGGIGITPVMSMLRYIRDRKLDRRILLIWGNKTEADIAFREELDALSREIPSIKVVHVLSTQKDWPGEKGFLTAQILGRYTRGFEKARYFVCGPPLMMTFVVRTLRRMSITKSRIHYERFALI